MNTLNKLRIISTYYSKCRPFVLVPLKTEFSYRWKTISVPITGDNNVIANLCEKLKCMEFIAKTIYDKCPTLRSIDAIRNDSLLELSTKLSLLSIIENPELMTMDLGKIFHPFYFIFISF